MCDKTNLARFLLNFCIYLLNLYLDFSLGNQGLI